MKRKLLAVPVALGVLVAYALVPAIAAAINDPDLTQPTGTMLTTGSKFKGTNVGAAPTFTTYAGSALLQCTKSELTGTLTKNNGTEVEADIETLSVSGTGPEGRCTGTGVFPPTHWIFNPGTNGLPWCLRSTPTMKDDEVQIRGGSCTAASRPIRLVQHTTIATSEKPTDVLECVYERTAAITGTYSTHPEDAILNLSGAEWVRTEGGITCAAAWTVDLGLLTLERDEATTAPFYIS
jgi:hypothetical protein